MKARFTTLIAALVAGTVLVAPATARMTQHTGDSSAAMMLRQVEGLSTAETAEVLGVSEDVVKTRFSRARHALQQELLDRTGSATKDAFTFGQAHCDAVVLAVMARITPL